MQVGKECAAQVAKAPSKAEVLKLREAGFTSQSHCLLTCPLNGLPAGGQGACSSGGQGTQQG